MRVAFDSIFNQIDGRIIPRGHIAIGNATFAAGASLSPVFRILGVEVTRLTNCDLAVEDEDGISVIVGYYKDGRLIESEH